MYGQGRSLVASNIVTRTNDRQTDRPFGSHGPYGERELFRAARRRVAQPDHFVRGTSFRAWDMGWDMKFCISYSIPLTFTLSDILFMKVSEF